MRSTLPFTGMSSLNEIEAAVDRLPPPQQEELLLSLTVRLRSRGAHVPNRLSDQRSVLEIAPVNVGEVLFARSDDSDLLGEMLEGRA